MTGNGVRECILERGAGNGRKSQSQKWLLLGYMAQA
nr:MAG TPA: hypothetical protein [Caudoviricetes sp.]